MALDSEYVRKAFDYAREKVVHCILIQIDTPGGLDSSMREIVKLIMNSKIPVVVYIAPKGARAASAGVFIAFSSHILAMSPGTNIGAAHPVSLMRGGMDKTMEEKVVNDATAYIRSIAERRGRNVRWAEKAVRESVSVVEADLKWAYAPVKIRFFPELPHPRRAIVEVRDSVVVSDETNPLTIVLGTGTAIRTYFKGVSRLPSFDYLVDLCTWSDPPNNV